MSSHVHETADIFPGASSMALDWEMVYVEQLPRVYNFLRYRTGDETLAEELTARTFEKAWRKRHRYRRDLAGVATWLLRIARNTAFDYRRTFHAHAPLEAAAGAPAPDNPEDEAVVDSNFARLGRLIVTLPDRERELLALKYGAGATNRAIADVTGISESNVGTILHRAVQKLRAEW
jgi:RNA polymerase sigma-70 factor (ECF subfamily)